MKFGLLSGAHRNNCMCSHARYEHCTDSRTSNYAMCKMIYLHPSKLGEY